MNNQQLLNPLNNLKNQILLDLRKERIQLESRLTEYLSMQKLPIKLRAVSLSEINNMILEISIRLKEIETSLEEIKKHWNESVQSWRQIQG